LDREADEFREHDEDGEGEVVTAGAAVERLIRLDVALRDHAGRPVAGLGRDDLTLLPF
jgi:hypothetical protein